MDFRMCRRVVWPCLAALNLSVSSAGTAVPIPDHLYLPMGRVEPARSYFTVLRGFPLEKGALAEWKRLKEEAFDVPLAIYKAPLVSTSPYTLVAASYATEAEADRVTHALRSRFGTKFASTVRMAFERPDSGPAKGPRPAKNPYLAGYDPANPPLPIGGTHETYFAPRNAVTAPSAAEHGEGRKVAVLLREFTSGESAAREIEALRQKYPGLQFGIYEHTVSRVVQVEPNKVRFVLGADCGGPPTAQAASFAEADIGLEDLLAGAPNLVPAITGLLLSPLREVDRSIRCIYEIPVPGVTSITFASKSFSVALAGYIAPTELRDITHWARKAGIAEPLRTVDLSKSPMLDPVLRKGEEYLAPAAVRVVECYTQRKETTVDGLARCSGLWLTPGELTRCLLESRCTGLALDPVRDAARIATFLAVNRLEIGSTLALDARSLGMLADPDALRQAIKRCDDLKSALQSQADAAEGARLLAEGKKCFAELALSGADRERLACVTAGKSESDLVSCLLPGTEPGSLGKIVACVRAAKSDRTALAACVAEPEAIRAAKAYDECIASVSSRSSLWEKCVPMVLSGPAQQQVACLSKAVTTEQQAGCLGLSRPGMPAQAAALMACFPAGATVGAKAACLATQVGGDAARIAECLSKSAATILEQVACAHGGPEALGGALACLSDTKAEATKVAECIASRYGGNAGQIAVCIGASQGDYAKLVACASQGKPEMQQAVAAGACLAGARDNAERIRCAGAFIDPRAAALSECIAKAGGDRARIAGCGATAVLPPEAAKVAGCATSATGAVDFALCAGGAQMNAEWRTAAECATSTGGEPISFAGCTAGRLFVAELQKCMSGKIGQEGGCFGPNNTIVVIVREVGKALGAVAQAVAQGLAQVAKNIETLPQQVQSWLTNPVDALRRGEIGRIFCGIFGC